MRARACCGVLSVSVLQGIDLLVGLGLSLNLKGKWRNGESLSGWCFFGRRGPEMKIEC